MSSATSTEARAERVTLPVVIGGGWLLILLAYRWHFTASVFFLATGWVALVVTARLLWTSFWSLAIEPDSVQDDALRVTQSKVGDLQREKKALLRAIKDVEFDRDMGKMSGDEAEQIIRVYRARAIEIIKQLDATAEQNDEDLPPGEIIARELSVRLGDDIEPLDVGTPKSKPTPKQKPKPKKPTSAVCADCKTRNDPDAAFCKKCGTKLAEASS